MPCPGPGDRAERVQTHAAGGGWAVYFRGGLNIEGAAPRERQRCPWLQWPPMIPTIIPPIQTSVQDGLRFIIRTAAGVPASL